MIETRTAKLLGIKFPIFQGGMLWREETCEKIRKSIETDYAKVFERMQQLKPANSH